MRGPQRGELAAMRQAWHSGDETFRDRLLALVTRGGKALRNRGGHSGKAVAAPGEREVEHLVGAGLLKLGLCDEHERQFVSPFLMNDNSSVPFS